MLAPLVLAAQQPVGSFGSCAGHDVRHVHRHAGQHRHAVASLGVDIRTGLYEVARAPDTDVTHRRNTIDIVIAGVNDSNRHSLTPESGLVQFVPITHGYLPNGRAIDTVRMYGRLVDQ